MRKQQIKQILINYNMGLLTANEAMHEIAAVLVKEGWGMTYADSTLIVTDPIQETGKAETNEELAIYLTELFKL